MATVSVTSSNGAPMFDVAVLGAGPGGYVAAIRAAQLGLKVALIERDQLGGICLNWGCIPTKVLLRNAEVVELIKDGEAYGISYDNLRVDYAKAYKRSREVSNRLVKGIEFLMKKNDIKVFIGDGTLVAPNAILVEHRGEERTITASNLIVATGAKPLVLPFLKPDGVRVFTYRQLLEVQHAPKSMVVIGSGAIGMEFAYVFHAYGSDVTVLEALPRIMPLEDEEISAEITRSFNRRGIKTIAGAKVTDAKVGADGVEVFFESDKGMQSVKSEWVLVAVSVTPNTAGIGLDKVGVKVNHAGYIEVDDHMATNVPGIYAIGDVTGKLRLAHVAQAQGVVAAESIAAKMGKYHGHIPKLDYDAMPRCTYTIPQVASMGLSEAQAKEKGYEVKVGKFPLRANGKSLALNNTEGFVKVVADAKYGEILGVHCIGPDVTELLPEFVLAKNAELTPAEIARAVHAHPTLSESLMEAAEGVGGLPIHI
ncbi:MAG: dihydrolipoyl dehydrogenase [Candidatus Brachytrichaceae bacterium NZ_4S206]